MVVRIQFRPDQLTDYQSTLLVTPCPTCSARPITVTNTSKAPLAVKTLTLSGSPDLTAALDGGALPRTLGPGETVAGTARYQPRNLGLQQAQASLQAVEGGPGILSMSGAGTGPWLQMKPKSLFVGPAAIGTTRTSTVTATNVGYDPARAAPLALTAVYLGKNDGTWSVQSGARSVGPAGRTLPPGGRMSVRLEFVAEQAQTYSGSVRFYVSNRSAPAKTVDLVGAGDSSCFFVDPTTVDFGAAVMGCGIPDQMAYAVNQCTFPVTVTRVETAGAYFSSAPALPIRITSNTNAAIPISYAPPSPGDDVGAIEVYTDMRAEPFQAGITGGAQIAATLVDQWDQSTPKVDLLIVIDNSGSMAEEQKALAQNLDRLWNRIALANADYHIAVTSTGMFKYTGGWTQCPGGAFGGEAGRFFPVDNSRPRILTPQTPDVKNVLFANTNVGLCHYDERFLDPVLAALTDPLISSTKAPGTPLPNDGNAGFLRDDARLALMAVSDADDSNDVVNPAPVSDYVRRLAKVKHGALDLISFAGIVPLRSCPSTSEGIGQRYMEIAQHLHGHLEDICDLGNFGPMLESSLGDLLMPLTSFPLSARPRDPASILVTVNGVTVTGWSYDATSNRIVFPDTAVPPPGSHITARYEPA